jgi:hypothetical protein
MQAIVTKYIGPTNHRGARVKATCQAGSVVIPYDYALGTYENHDAAARALLEKLGWCGQWFGGGMPDGTGNCYVRDDDRGVSIPGDVATTAEDRARRGLEDA